MRRIQREQQVIDHALASAVGKEDAPPLRAARAWICAAMLLCVAPCHAVADVDLAAEPPVVLELLNEAMTLELYSDDPNKMQRAVMLYCKASRFGSLEAQYRFGMLYLSGKGVPRNIAYATTLFSQAAQQGYAQAMLALDVVSLRPLELPPCLS